MPIYNYTLHNRTKLKMHYQILVELKLIEALNNLKQNCHALKKLENLLYNQQQPGKFLHINIELIYMTRNHHEFLLKPFLY